MKPLLWNLILAIAWMALTGAFDPTGFVVGLVLGYVVVALAGPAVGVRGYGGQIPRSIGFFFFYLGELVMANLRVAVDVVRPRSRSRPGFIAIGVEDMTATQITVLANLITMTPGTLSIDVSGDRKTLYIHSMFVDDADSLRNSIEETLVRRVKAVFP